MTDPLVARIAEAHKKNPAQILLRHLLQLGLAVIPKSSNPDRIRQNLQVRNCFDIVKNAEICKVHGGGSSTFRND